MLTWVTPSYPGETILRGLLGDIIACDIRHTEMIPDYPYTLKMRLALITHLWPCTTIDEAKEAAEVSLQHWLAAAGLKVAK
jgi:hypothetical protein